MSEHEFDDLQEAIVHADSALAELKRQIASRPPSDIPIGLIVQRSTTRRFALALENITRILDHQ